LRNFWSLGDGEVTHCQEGYRWKKIDRFGRRNFKIFAGEEKKDLREVAKRDLNIGHWISRDAW
jgi:hypothetical protein